MSKNLAALTLAFLTAFAAPAPAFADDGGDDTTSDQNADVNVVFVPGPHHGGSPGEKEREKTPAGEPHPAESGGTDAPVRKEENKK